jgi:cytidylate kinase
LNLEEIRENLEKRDHIDATREESPLRKADDAVILDTSGITLDEQVQEVVTLAKEKMMENA